MCACVTQDGEGLGHPQRRRRGQVAGLVAQHLRGTSGGYRGDRVAAGGTSVQGPPAAPEAATASHWGSPAYAGERRPGGSGSTSTELNGSLPASHHSTPATRRAAAFSHQ